METITQKLSSAPHRLVAKAVAAERKRCAKIAEKYANEHLDRYHEETFESLAARKIAKLILDSAQEG